MKPVFFLAILLFARTARAQPLPLAEEKIKAVLAAAKGITFTSDEVNAILAAAKGLSAEQLVKTGVDHVKAENEKAKDDRKATAFFFIAAELKSMDAQSRLGFMYHQGLGVVLDYVAAADWFRKAADRGYPKAQFNLGLMYMLGQGMPVNEEIALDLLRKSARQGYQDAQSALKEMALTW